MSVLSLTYRLPDIADAAEKVRISIAKKDPFVLLLEGGLGAGKTTLISHLLHGFGLKKGAVVNSPTFSLANEYQIGGEFFCHLDLYRLSGEVSLEEFFLTRDFRGFFIEWGLKHEKALPVLPTHLLKLKVGAKEDERNLTLYQNPWPDQSSFK